MFAHGTDAVEGGIDARENWMNKVLVKAGCILSISGEVDLVIDKKVKCVGIQVSGGMNGGKM